MPLVGTQTRVALYHDSGGADNPASGVVAGLGAARGLTSEHSSRLDLQSAMSWEILASLPTAAIRRRGRFVVADLSEAHLTITTSVKNGGQAGHVRHLVNHQSCEGAGHETRFRFITDLGQEAYHDSVCDELGLLSSETAVMGTAANMNYVAITTEPDADVDVTAIVTAGVQTNAICAGDPASWRETPEGITKVAAVAGTINTMLLLNRPMTAAALARAVVTMTEAKSAALQRLAVPSCYSADLATGTGTDQFCVAAPSGGGKPLTSASPHMKVGELIGLAVRRATGEALRWQNGLEASLTRGLFHALGRYGLIESDVFRDLAPLLDPSDLDLLKKNSKAAFYEPLVGAAAHALAAVLDRVRHGTIPESSAPDAVVQQAATLATSLAARPDAWPEFRAHLHRSADKEPKSLVLAAVALGWTAKWRTD
jgi:adenosylcobinamide hydrolase